MRKRRKPRRLRAHLGFRARRAGAQLLHAGGGKIREADYILVHHTAGRYENAAAEMDVLLGLKHTGLRTIQCRTGKFRTL